MARRSSSTFVAPRGEDGKFLPYDEWPKKTQKEFEKLRENGAFQGKRIKKNPVVKSSSGRRKGKDIWIPPHDKSGRFLPMEKWSESEKKAYKRALKKGMVPGSLVPRGQAGRFSGTAPSRVRSRKSGEAVHPQDEWFASDDVYDIKRGIRRLEHRFEDLLDEIDRATRRRREEPPLYPVHTLSAHECEGGSCECRNTQATQIYEDREYGEYDDPPIDAEYSEDPCEDDPCQGEILSGIKKLSTDIKQIQDSCLGELGKFRDIKPNRSLSRYHRDRSIMYNRPRTLGQRFDVLAGYIKAHPVIAIVGFGAIALIGFALYKMIRTIMSNFVAGASIRQGVMSFPGAPNYAITQEDSLWLIRAIWGEVNRSNQNWEMAAVQRGAAAVMWALANNYMTVGRKRELYPTFGQYIQAYCQPINPIWSSAGASGCQRNPSACTADRLAFRQALRSKQWAEFPSGAQALVTAFVAGTLSNPIGRRTDWAAAGEGRVTADAVNIAGNVFITDPNARSRTA